jgi:predicted alpha/beta superfamily hydrolase
LNDRWTPYPPENDEARHTVSGRVVHASGVASPQLFNQRDVWVYLPRGYGEEGRRFPVLYMQDGQNLFDDATSFAGEWHLDEALEAATDVPPCIIVGIANTGPRRMDEYTPFDDARHGGGDGEKYLDFLVGTLKPIIDTDFATLPDAENTGIGGSSLGGLLSLYGFFARPDTFGFAAVMSPSIWFADRTSLRWVWHAAECHGRLYIDVGTAEGRRTVADARRLRRMLQRMGYVEGRNLRYLEVPGAAHNEGAWGPRFPAALDFLLRESVACERGQFDEATGTVSE